MQTLCGQFKEEYNIESLLTNKSKRLYMQTLWTVYRRIQHRGSTGKYNTESLHADNFDFSELVNNGTLLVNDSLGLNLKNIRRVLNYDMALLDSFHCRKK